MKKRVIRHINGTVEVLKTDVLTISEKTNICREVVTEAFYPWLSFLMRVGGVLKLWEQLGRCENRRDIICLVEQYIDMDCYYANPFTNRG